MRTEATAPAARRKVQTDAKLWIEVVPSAEAKKLYFNEISSTRPFYKHTLMPGTSGRIEVGPIPEPGPSVHEQLALFGFMMIAAR